MNELIELMSQRRALIQTAPGFRSGFTDRGSQAVLDAQDLDVEIARLARAQGLTEAQAWTTFEGVQS